MLEQVPVGTTMRSGIRGVGGGKGGGGDVVVGSMDGSHDCFKIH